MLSTEAGVQSCLFSLTIPAAVYCGIINPECNPGLYQEQGQALLPADELVGSSFGYAADLGHGNGKIIERQGQRLSVEIAPLSDEVVVGEDVGVIGNRVDLAEEYTQHMSETVFTGAMHPGMQRKEIRPAPVSFLRSDPCQYGSRMRAAVSLCPLCARMACMAGKGSVGTIEGVEG